MYNSTLETENTSLISIFTLIIKTSVYLFTEEISSYKVTSSAIRSIDQPFGDGKARITDCKQGNQIIVIHNCRATKVSAIGGLILVKKDVAKCNIIDMNVSHPSMPLEFLGFTC